MSCVDDALIKQCASSLSSSLLILNHKTLHLLKAQHGSLRSSANTFAPFATKTASINTINNWTDKIQATNNL